MVAKTKKQMYRNKYGRRSQHQKLRSEKQVLLARHKQGKKAAARKLGISPTHMMWVNNELVFVANGKSVRDALMLKGGTTTGVK